MREWRPNNHAAGVTVTYKAPKGGHRNGLMKYRTERTISILFSLRGNIFPLSCQINFYNPFSSDQSYQGLYKLDIRNKRLRYSDLSHTVRVLVMDMKKVYGMTN